MAAPAGEGVKTLAEATLAVVLFADASRIKPCVLRREYRVPLRPATPTRGRAAADDRDRRGACRGDLRSAQSDRGGRVGDTAGAHGRGTRRGGRDRAATPVTIRQGLNVESGLNDVYVPLLIALAAAEVEDKAASGSHAIRIVAEQIGYGILGGAARG
jgi:hypothetical protein